MEDDSQTLRNKLADELVSAKCIKSPDMERAFRKVPRHFFLKNVEVTKVYTNDAIVTKLKDNVPVSSSSQPSLMVDMLEALDIQKDMRVLEIGAGTGYNAALIAELTQNPESVYSVDIQKDVVDQCRVNLSEAGYAGIHVIHSDGGYGYPSSAPYDRIIVTCQPWDIPPAWIEQLKDGGISVIPLSIEPNQPSFMIPKFVKREGCLVSKAIVSGGFMAMQGDFTFPIDERLEVIMVIDPNDCDRPQESNFQIASRYVNPKHLDQDTKVTIQHLFDSWERKGNVKFGSWYEEYGLITIMILEGVSKFRAWSKSSKYGFEGTGTGILDINNSSAALVASGKGDIIIYGSNVALENLSNIVTQWEAVGRPKLADFQVIVYSKDRQIVPKSNEWLIQKPSVQVLLSVVSSPLLVERR